MKKHPGKITNAELLHKEAKYLKGTGEVADFEADVMDTYLHEDVRENRQFEIINEEIWKFISSRYGQDTTIKRYYVNKGSSFWSSSELDCRLEQIPVFIARSDDLYSGRAADQFKVEIIQMPGKKTFSDAKKRIADVVTAKMRATNPRAPAVKATKIRLWLSDDEHDLKKSFKTIAMSDQHMADAAASSNSDSGEESKSETNSGVSFPGESIEPYVGSILTIEEFEFMNKVVVVEIGSPNFAYQYEDKGRI